MQVPSRRDTVIDSSKCRRNDNSAWLHSLSALIEEVIVYACMILDQMLGQTAESLLSADNGFYGQNAAQFYWTNCTQNIIRLNI